MMLREEWDGLFEVLAFNLATIQSWELALPDPSALRCEHSRHRTLAHLRACQQQWLFVVDRFIDREAPSVKILHPWRLFEAENYALAPWEVHMSRFIEDRQRWLNLGDTVDWERGGKWNQKPDTIGGLTKRLADHEAYHVRLSK